MPDSQRAHGGGAIYSAYKPAINWLLLQSYIYILLESGLLNNDLDTFWSFSKPTGMMEVIENWKS